MWLNLLLQQTSTIDIYSMVYHINNILKVNVIHEKFNFDNSII